MNINLRTIDLNLLTIFESLMQLQNLSHCADELGMTQSAASHALKRLQNMYDDPLFVRKNRKMEPTKKAISIYPILQNTLMAIRTTLPIKGDFDPAKVTLELRVNIENLGIYPFIFEFAKQLKQRAPNITLILSNDLLDDKEKSLRNREYDLDIDILPSKALSCHDEVLYEDDISVFVSKNHNRLKYAESISAEQFFNEEHAVIAPKTLNSYPLEQLDKHFSKRKIGFICARFNDVKEIVRNTDLIAVLPTNHFNSKQDSEHIKCLSFPFERVPKLPIILTWHQNVEFYKPHRWCRNLLLSVTKQ